MQGISGFNHKHITGTAAGTTQVFTGPTNLVRLVIPANKTGTVSLYDNGTSGTTSAGFINDFPNTVGSIPTNIELGIAVQHGIIAVYGGTVDFNVVYGG